MTAIELFLASGKPAGVWFCEKCRTVAPSKLIADRCCNNYQCSTCGKDTGSRSWLVCEPCRIAAEESKERERFEKAEKLTVWDGWVFHGDEFYESVEAMLELLDEMPHPEYVWAAKEIHFVQADLDDILDRMTDDAYEDFDPETLDGLDELNAALEKFNEVNAKVCSYAPDYAKAVLIQGEP